MKMLLPTEKPEELFFLKQFLSKIIPRISFFFIFIDIQVQARKFKVSPAWLRKKVLRTLSERGLSLSVLGTE